MKRTRKSLLHQLKPWKLTPTRKPSSLDVLKTPAPKTYPPSNLPTDNSTATFNLPQKPQSANSMKPSHQNSPSSNTAPSPKVVKSPVKNPNNPKRSQNGASKTSKQ